ncbi:transcriptional regulator [Verrucosispora sp. ts21]|uniref:winged helix-turn-helix transcriptional regulator n=1 Tax=Micromonospora TaxID=1873 RepID=UPI000C882E80|nr:MULTISPECIES: helix-turn-helix domain-containing protein [Micromonospora]PMR62713.1 transcriptional regulator [Verrucosispora sp. ts21]WSK45557.1 helix-turn-helix transcriptional regulator [Micromonospora maris]
MDECRETKEAMQGVQGVLETLGRRWTGEILTAGVSGARRFREYRRTVNGISDRMLTLRLRELETLGLLARTVVPSSPVQVYYTPTSHAMNLLQAVRPLARWGEQHMARAEAHRVASEQTLAPTTLHQVAA